MSTENTTEELAVSSATSCSAIWVRVAAERIADMAATLAITHDAPDVGAITEIIKAALSDSPPNARDEMRRAPRIEMKQTRKEPLAAAACSVTPEMVKAALDEYVQYIVPVSSITTPYRVDEQRALQAIASHINKSLNAKMSDSPGSGASPTL